MSPTDETPEGHEEPERGEHEHVDVDPARIALWGGGLLVGTAVTAMLAAGGYAIVQDIEFSAVFKRQVDRVERPLPPQPRLENDPSATRRKVESQARERLRTWEWIDRQDGVARIPIDRAMEVVVDQYQRERRPPSFLGAPGAGSPDAGTTAPDAGAPDSPDASSDAME